VVVLTVAALTAWIAVLAPAADRDADPPGLSRVPVPVPVPTGRRSAFRLAPRARSLHGQPIDGLACRAAAGQRVQAHIELFAYGRVMPIPPGIGMAPPLLRRGAHVLRGRCSYPVRTTEPTGVLELRARPTVSLGELFDIWGQPLSSTRLAAFRGSVRAYIAGRRWRGDPRAVPIVRHGVIAIEVGEAIQPHPSYRFPDQP
jgi:hypothetical protein